MPSVRLWGTAEQAATEGGVSRAAAAGVEPDLQEAAFFKFTEGAGSVIRKGLSDPSDVRAAVQRSVIGTALGSGVTSDMLSFNMADLGDPRNRDAFYRGSQLVWQAAGVYQAVANSPAVVPTP